MIHIAHKIQLFNSLIKALLVIAFLSVVFYRLVYIQDSDLLWAELSSRISADRLWILGLVILLMPLNWFLEAGKWRLLMKPALAISLGRALHAVMSGVAISLFTPNRIGEYGGRILFVPSEYNWRAIVATLVGSFGQNLVHITFGMWAVAMFLLNKHVLPGMFRPGMVILIGGLLLVLVIAYGNLPKLSRWMASYTPPAILRKPWSALGYIQKITQRDLAIALVFASLRYLAFSTQFVLLLLFFQIAVPIEWIIAGVAVMFLMQTSVPLPPFVDVVARSELALVLWSIYNVNELAVVSASFLLWIINLLVPAFFGLLAMSRINVLQSLGYEENVELAAGVDSAVDPVVGIDNLDRSNSLAPKLNVRRRP